LAWNRIVCTKKITNVNYKHKAIKNEGKGRMQRYSASTSRLVGLFLWQALCVAISLYILFITWNGRLIDVLYNNGMYIPAIQTFKTAMYVFLGGMIGSALYVSYRIYSHVVYPDNDVLTGDLTEKKDKSNNKMTPAEIRKEEAEQRAEEGRRFNSRTILYWYLRPLMGGVAGLVSLTFIGIIVSPFSSVGCSSGYHFGHTVSFAFFGMAFISGFCFGDFVKFLQARARIMLKTRENIT
jgi:hypothetical protein